MIKKYKVVKFSNVVGSEMTTKETHELAKFDVDLVEVADNNKNEVIAASKDADIILWGGCSDNTLDNRGSTKMHRNHYWHCRFR